MKKFLAIFLVLTLLFSFAACDKNGKDDESTTNPTEQTDDNGTTNKNEPSSKKEEQTTAEPFVNPNRTEPANLFKIVDVKNYKVEERKPNSSATTGATFLSKRYELNSKKESNISDKIKIDANEIIIGVSALSELLNNGWETVGNVDSNTAVKVGEKATVLIKNNENKVIQINVKNNTSSISAISNCTIIKVSILKELEKYSWKDFIINDVVNLAKASYKDYVAALGEPLVVNITEYYNGNNYSHCKVSMMFQQTKNGNTYTITVAGEDNTGELVFNSCIVEVK